MIITFYERSLYCEQYEQKTLYNAVKIDFTIWKENKPNYATITTETGEKTLVNVKDIILIEQ